MATFTVTTAQDVVDPNDGRLSLREAVAQANATGTADAIRFAAGLEGQTLALTGGELALTRDVRIDGDRNDDGQAVTLDGNANGRLLRISGGGTDVALDDLTLANGRSESDVEGGGGIFLGGRSLSLDGCTIQDCYSGAAGGAIFAGGGSRVTVTDSGILENFGYHSGGGIVADGDVSLVVRGSELSGNVGFMDAGAIGVLSGSSLVLEDSVLTGNGRIGMDYLAFGGAVGVLNATATIARSTIAENLATSGGGIGAFNSRVTVTDSTVAGNQAAHQGFYSARGGGLAALGDTELVVRNTTVTGNVAELTSGGYGVNGAFGGGIAVGAPARLDLANSIVAGNVVRDPDGTAQDPDIFGAVALSNGRNLFGTDVAGDVAGDRENVAPGAVFAALDPDTGGGLLSPGGIVLLRDDPANPALSGGDPLAAGAVGQLGTTPRPLPPGSLPDIGAIEINQGALSTSPSDDNDVLTGTGGANALSGMDGNDLLRGLAGADALSGDAGSDLLDGGPGNDGLDGGMGVDLVSYASGGAAVVVNLAAGTARRGGETDALSGVEGAIGSSAADSFTGDGLGNWFQGGAGKDVYTLGGGRDVVDLDRAAHSGPGAASRDVVADFAHLVDDLDLAGIDADATAAGDQAFRFVGTAALSGAGQVGFSTSGGNTVVRASTDADAAAELQVQLNGLVPLTVDDFYL